jgi:hypothetical protein
MPDTREYIPIHPLVFADTQSCFVPRWSWYSYLDDPLHIPPFR